MNTDTEFAMFKIFNKLFEITGDSRIADRLVSPILHWVTSGRCTGKEEFIIRKLSNRQISFLAKKLVTFGNQFGDYADTTNLMRAFLKHIEKEEHKNA